MAGVISGSAQYYTKFAEQTILGNYYAISKLGIDRAQCFLKIGGYLILCTPFQLGFKRSIFMASISKKEMVFFQRYINTIVGLSISLNPDKRPEPVKFFLRCTLNTIGQMKGRENVGLFVVNYKSSPDEMVTMMGSFMETLERLKTLYDEDASSPIRMTPAISKAMGYNVFATVTGGAAPPKRMQVLGLAPKQIEYVEAAPPPSTPVLKNGAQVAYQLFFRQYRVSVNGTISASEPLRPGIVRNTAALEFSPELVEIIEDFRYNSQMNLPPE
ncbi:MAG: hypothetical protein FWD91_01790 [Treponema sp.]|nr:hypothetical protein [Treponema sp.]